jgi:hypothetical protein
MALVKTIEEEMYKACSRTADEPDVACAFVPVLCVALPSL